MNVTYKTYDMIGFQYYMLENTTGRVPQWAKMLHQNRKVVSSNPNGRLAGLKDPTHLQKG